MSSGKVPLERIMTLQNGSQIHSQVSWQASKRQSCRLTLGVFIPLLVMIDDSVVILSTRTINNYLQKLQQQCEGQQSLSSNHQDSGYDNF